MVKAPVPQGTQTRRAYQGFSSMKQPIGPLQLVIHVVKNRLAGGRTGTRQTKEITILDDTSSLSCPSTSLALQYDGFVPRELPAANCKGPFLRFFC